MEGKERSGLRKATGDAVPRLQAIDLSDLDSAPPSSRGGDTGAGTVGFWDPDSGVRPGFKLVSGNIWVYVRIAPTRQRKLQ